MNQERAAEDVSGRRRNSLRRRLGLLAAAGVLAGLAAAVGSTWFGGGERGEGVAQVQVADDVPVTAMDARAKSANNSPSIVADPTEPRFVVMANRLDAPGFSCALQLSGDGGRGWVTANPKISLPDGADRCYAPEAAFDANGVLYYSFVGLEGAGNEPMGIFLTSSPDRGRTWSAPWRVLGPASFGVRMAIDPTQGPEGRIHLVWLQATSDPPLGGFEPPPNPIMAAYSDDGGRTFSSPREVSDPSALAVAPSLALGPDHAVHVVYFDLQDDTRDYFGLEGPVWEGTWSVVVATSTDGGEGFGPGVVVDDGVVPWARPMLIYTLAPPALVAGEEDQLCTAWTDARHGDADAVVACSHDGGGRWEDARRLNDDEVANGASQYLPQLGLSPDGRLDAVFYDRRDDPANLRAHVRYTFSTDGGAHFARNVRLTSEDSDVRVGQQYTNVSAEGQYEVGSRLGLLSRRSEVLAAWADARNSLPSTTAQDLFATTVTLSGPSSTQLDPLVAGALGTGTGLAGAAIYRRIRR